MSRPAAPPNPVMALVRQLQDQQAKAERRAAKKEPPPAPAPKKKARKS